MPMTTCSTITTVMTMKVATNVSAIPNWPRMAIEIFTGK